MFVWNPEGVDDALWERLRRSFSEEQIVELGAYLALSFGQQRVLNTWGLGHEEGPRAAAAEVAAEPVQAPR